MAKRNVSNYDRPGTGFGYRRVSGAGPADAAITRCERNFSNQHGLARCDGFETYPSHQTCSDSGLSNEDSPITRMLPGSTPCELRLMLPDVKLGIDGFHDIIIENLTASPTWRSSHISPADITALRRRWPKDAFRTLSCRAPDVERLRRDAWKRLDRAFRHSGPGYCTFCDEKVYMALDARMIAFHLELAQLWRCPVRGVEGVSLCMLGTFDREAWGLDINGHEERG